MKIKHFNAEGVHGYLSYDIDFRENLTFLIGLNGSGKTTVLKLISGLLTPNYFYLVQTKFSKIELTLHDENKYYVITAEQDEEKIHLNFNNEAAEKFDIITNQAINELYETSYLDESEIPEPIRKFCDSKYAKIIKQLVKPIVLGLDRRVTESLKIDIRRTAYPMRRRYLRSRYEGVDKALVEIRDLLHDKVRENANKKEQLSNKFKEELLVELTKLTGMPSLNNVLSSKIDFRKELKNLKNRQEQFNDIARSLKILALKNSFDIFFDKAESVLNQLLDIKNITKNLAEEEKDRKFVSLIFEWTSISYQLDNVDKTIKIGTNFSNDIEKIDSSFNRLKKSLNLFFAETNKEVDISGEGDLVIKTKMVPELSKENSIFELSSGEKQLIILFSRLAFAQDSENDIFIVDEPELSLHLSWQEKFVDALQTACPAMQFVLATHAPAIIANQDWQNNCEDLSESK